MNGVGTKTCDKDFEIGRVDVVSVAISLVVAAGMFSLLSTDWLEAAGALAAAFAMATAWFGPWAGARIRDDPTAARRIACLGVVAVVAAGIPFAWVDPEGVGWAAGTAVILGLVATVVDGLTRSGAALADFVAALLVPPVAGAGALVCVYDVEIGSLVFSVWSSIVAIVLKTWEVTEFRTGADARLWAGRISIVVKRRLAFLR